MRCSGDPWFHEPRVVNAGTYPWLACMGSGVKGSGILDKNLLAQLKLPEFQADSS
jgi:asparagine synthase (glutamine-hydrolysing)